MKTILFIGLIVLVLFTIYGFIKPKREEIVDGKGIHFFEGTWQQALLEAKSLDQPIFLDVYATWCGPCKQLKKTTFKDEGVGNYFNKNFINVAIDGETQEGQGLIQKYNIRSYPSLLIIDSNGEVKTRTSGFKISFALIEFGRQIAP